MKRAIVAALGTGVVISSGAAISIGGAGGESMTHQQYLAALRSVAAAREQVPARCDPLPEGYERDYCRVEAEAAQKVRLAEIEESYHRTQKAARQAQRARIDARYQLDRARCGALRGFKRDKCLIQAHAFRGRGMLELAAPYTEGRY